MAVLKEPMNRDPAAAVTEGKDIIDVESQQSTLKPKPADSMNADGDVNES
jgi:hypothetical protein